MLICVAFVPLGQLLGRLLGQHPRLLLAYSVNIVGSLIGVWLFALLSYLYLPPVTWAVILMLLFVPLLVPFSRRTLAHATLTMVFVGCAWLGSLDGDYKEVVWSPYQKLAVQVVPRPYEDLLWIKVNNTGYQLMVDRRPEFTSQHPDAFDPAQTGLSQYDLPTVLKPNAKRVLIAGAGAGNDAAGALRGGAGQITAVDIDPAIVWLGQRYHPEQPYSSERVKVIIDDARSYFASSDQKYDLIVFGLLDAHTTTALTNARLDHYVYTAQSIAQARRLLTPDGVMVLSFAADFVYITDRIASTLRQEFGRDPLLFHVPKNAYGFGGVMFVCGDLEQVQARLAENPRLSALIEHWRADNPWHEHLTGTIPIATDDWPYLYLPGPTIPPVFLAISALLVFVLLAVKRVLKMPTLVQSWSVSHTHFALLGAAFLLLEVQNISKASIVLGNTWLVSAIIISGVLLMILLANTIVTWWPRIPTGPVGVVLCATCIGLYFTDLGQFAGLPPVAKGLVVGALTTVPMVFSGILFIRSLSLALHKQEALGANLIGSLAGGLMQALTFLTGTSALLLMVAAMYAAAVLLTPRGRSERTETPARSAEPVPAVASSLN